MKPPPVFKPSPSGANWGNSVPEVISLTMGATALARMSADMSMGRFSGLSPVMQKVVRTGGDWGTLYLDQMGSGNGSADSPTKPRAGASLCESAMLWLNAYHEARKTMDKGQLSEGEVQLFESMTPTAVVVTDALHPAL